MGDYFLAGYWHVLPYQQLLLVPPLLGMGAMLLWFSSFHLFIFLGTYTQSWLFYLSLLLGMVFVQVKGNKQRVFAWLLIHSVGFIAVNLVDKDYFSLQKIKAGVSNMVIFLTVFFLIVLYLLRSSHKKPS